MAQKTAVEWLVEKFEECELMYGTIQSLIHKQYLDGIIKQAKQMEKEQIVHAFGVGCHVESKRLIGYHGMAEQYYNETYGKDSNEPNA